jgi:hypothetical protein
VVFPPPIFSPATVMELQEDSETSSSKEDDEDQEKDENLKKRSRPILDRSSKQKKQIEVDTSYSEGSAEYDTDDNDDMSKNRSSKNKYHEDSDFEIEDDNDNKEVEEQNDVLNDDVNQHRANSDGLDWNNGAFNKNELWDKKLYSMDFCEWQGKMNWRSSANCMDHAQRRSLVPCIATLTEMFARYSQHPGKEDWPQQEWVLLQLTDIDGYGQKNPKKHRSKTAVNVYGRKEAIAKYNNMLTNTEEGDDHFFHRSTSSLDELQMFWKSTEKDEAARVHPPNESGGEKDSNVGGMEQACSVDLEVTSLVQDKVENAQASSANHLAMATSIRK